MLPTKKINNLISRFNNQRFYGEEVGAYVIRLENKIVLFDLPTYSKEIEEYLESFNKPLLALLSHGPCGIADGTIWQEKLNMKIYLHEEDKHNKWLEMKPDVLFNKPPHISNNLEIILTPGHTPGSVCLYEKTTKTLFTGDTFGGDQGKVWDFFKKDGNGDLKKRLESCRKLLGYNFETVLPFHYEMLLSNPKESLQKFVDRYTH